MRIVIIVSLFLLSRAQSVTPAGVQLDSCVWTAAGVLRVSWQEPQARRSDYYELQILSERDGQTLSVVSTASTEAELDILLPNRTYWLRARAHNAGTPSLGPGTWSDVGSPIECKTGEPKLGKRAPPRIRGTRTIETLRESEYTYDVDYLMNHNSGDILGDAAFLTATGSPNHSSPWNVTFRNATFTLYCVDILSVQVPGTITTGGNTSFADYASCNNNENATDPQCECDNWIDRKIGGLNPDDHCSTSAGSPCDHDHWIMDCTCNCSTSSLAYSAKYTGMMPVQSTVEHENVGQWYSWPKLTECAEHEQIGARRDDGTTCNWKRSPYARVLRGWQVLAEGWNYSSSSTRSMDATQIRHNEAVFRKAFARQPLQEWRCGSSEQEAGAQSTLLVI